MRILLLCLPLLVMTACTTPSPTEQQDSAPATRLDPDAIEDAIPREDLITRAGNNRHYTVLGKTYTVMDRGDNYIEQGVASWYGTKFHGRPTANGEKYSLYAMTAAHRSLPIPSYVKITNLQNGRTAIVRVNDRGPFHSERIIDLSYAAAVKLGYAEQGTARVEVKVIDTRSIPAASSSLASANAAYYLQVGAFSDKARAEDLVRQLQPQFEEPVTVRDSADSFHRVWIGPIANLDGVRSISELLEQQQLGSPKLVSP
jgi:rare lipoprotein A